MKKFQFKVSEPQSGSSDSIIVTVSNGIVTSAKKLQGKNHFFWDDSLPNVSNLIGLTIKEVEDSVKSSIKNCRSINFTPYVIKRRVKPQDICNRL
jgi:hypothetical protein